MFYQVGRSPTWPHSNMLENPPPLVQRNYRERKRIANQEREKQKIHNIHDVAETAKRRASLLVKRGFPNFY